ncbi:hypothetical protein PanWU01x14_094910 [Parasponia andersonii]|uniref:Uncharacterized protein n=1 Tax=Parasponia andersonii TaxID=3476 RepID=A0A2P5D5D7_PARAD|nr:hypothetical protein PanWU01x14_094910 [Parasponia andersonii]
MKQNKALPGIGTWNQPWSSFFGTKTKHTVNRASKKPTYHISALLYRERKIENTKQDQECCYVALYECFQPTGSVFVPIRNPSSIQTNASSSRERTNKLDVRKQRTS